MGKRPIIALMLAGLVTLGIPEPAGALSSVESCFVSAIARERASAGLGRLSVKSDLTSAARRHSARMASDGRIYHSSNLGSGISGWRSIGENVGAGATCSGLHRAFMNSPSHRAIILNRRFTQVGVGVDRGSDDRIYVTEVFVERGATARPARVLRTRVSRQRPVAPARAVRKPAPVPPPPRAEPLNVEILLSLVGLDTQNVSPATGRAMGV